MPTNILRKSSSVAQAKAAARSTPGTHRRIVITAGRVSIRAELLETETADRVWAVLPIFSTAELWGNSLHFETTVETGRERGARSIASLGDIYFWIEDDRVLIAFGRTPIAKGAEMRLPRPCNLWAKALDDVTLLKEVVPGEKVSVTAA